MLKLFQPGEFHPRLPFHMVWLSTSACNARCQHCSSSSAFQAPDELTTKEATGMIDQLVNAGVLDLAVSGGEPFLRRDLFEITRYAVRKGLNVGIGSNGGNVTKAQILELVECGISRFQVSLDGFEGAHDALRCWPGLFQRVIRTIENAARFGLRVHVCSTINKLNFQQLEDFVEFAAGLPIARVNLSRYVPTGRGTDGLDLSAAEWRSVIHKCISLRNRFKGKLEVVSHLAQQIMVDHEVEQMPGFIGCQAGIGQGCITAKGTVFPCVLLPIPLGNMREESLKQIWLQSPVIRELQTRATLQGECGNCAWKSRCGGCRAVAYARTGDYTAPDPRCWLVSPNKLQACVA